MKATMKVMLAIVALSVVISASADAANVTWTDIATAAEQAAITNDANWSLTAHALLRAGGTGNELAVDDLTDIDRDDLVWIGGTSYGFRLWYDHEIGEVGIGITPPDQAEVVSTGNPGDWFNVVLFSIKNQGGGKVLSLELSNVAVNGDPVSNLSAPQNGDYDGIKFNFVDYSQDNVESLEFTGTFRFTALGAILDDFRGDFIFGKDISIIPEATTANGIPHSWLLDHGLDTNDEVEISNPDEDVYTTIEEWILDTNPAQFTETIRVHWVGTDRVVIPQTSANRVYHLYKCDDLIEGGWTEIESINGTGSSLEFFVGDLMENSPACTFRVDTSLPEN